MNEAKALDPATLLCHDCISVGLTVNNIAELMAVVAKPLARETAVDEALIAESLLQRERVGSTAFGGGSAVPHARLPAISKVVGAFCVLAKPLRMNALDGAPVDIIYALLSPEHAGADHLKALAAVSRLLRDQSLLEKLRGAETGDAAKALLTAHGWSAAG